MYQGKLDQPRTDWLKRFNGLKIILCVQLERQVIEVYAEMESKIT